jgi:hypothetical protein
MKRTIHYIAKGIGIPPSEAITPSNNHCASLKLDKKASAMVIEMGLQRVAGNVFSCPSSQEFWKVKDGSLVRLTGGEVDNKENVAPAPKDDAEDFLQSILADLEF